MNTYNHDLSLSFYCYLCKEFGSEDVVRTRRRMVNALNSVNYEKKLAFIISGSKAEGLNDPESDTDFLIVLKDCLVYDNIEDVSNHKQNRHMTVPIIMDTNDTKPGYTRLKLYDRNHFTGNESLCCKIGNEILLSSESLRSTHFKNFEYITHGPCQSHPSGIFEVVFSFQCNKWIMQAEEWIHRSRSSWPHSRLIERILQYGVLFVPVGCKNSPRQDLEFRISFNVAEKMLVQSFTHVQFLCYALLKDICKNFIKPQYGDLVCSYFLKTIIFWVSEESMESSWKPHNLLRCFDLCFKRLVYCVTYNTCLHYFIPDLNLFEDRFSISEHDSLTCTLQSLYTDVFSFFQVVIPHLSAINVNSVSALPSLYLAGFNVVSSNNISRVPLLRLIRSLFSPGSVPGKEMYALILSRGFQKAAHSLPIKESCHITNKLRYRNYQSCLNHLLQGLHHDAVSGWLLLASFLYTRKQYQQCLHVLYYCLHKCTPDKILLQPFIDSNLQHEFNKEMQQHIKNGLQSTCKRRVVDCVRFETDSLIIPAELSQEASRMILFPPVVFAHFLCCISLHHLNHNREKMNALSDLETTVKGRYLIPDNRLKLSYKCMRIAREQLAKL